MKRRHDHDLKVCKRCGETDRTQLLRGHFEKPMSRGGRVAFLRGERPEVLFTIQQCPCGQAFYRLVVDNRKWCYECPRNV